MMLTLLGCALAPRKNAAEELRAVVAGLAVNSRSTPPSQAHPDHDGMTGAFVGANNVTGCLPEGKDANAQARSGSLSAAASVVETYLVRGHSTGGTVYLLPAETHRGGQLPRRVMRNHRI